MRVVGDVFGARSARGGQILVKFVESVLQLFNPSLESQVVGGQSVMINLEPVMGVPVNDRGCELASKVGVCVDGADRRWWPEDRQLLLSDGRWCRRRYGFAHSSPLSSALPGQATRRRYSRTVFGDRPTAVR